MLYMRIPYECDRDTLRTLPCCLRSAAPQHSRQEQSSCSHSYSQLLFRILLAQLFLQLCGDGGKHPAERQSNFCWISFQLYPFPDPVHHMATETCTLSQRSGLCAEGQRDYFWALDAGMAYSASAELQPKGAVAGRIGRSSGKENSPKESVCCPVVARAHSLSTPTTGAEQDREEVHSTGHLQRTGQGGPLCVHHGSRSGSTENQALRDADRIKNTGCRCIYYVN